MVFLMVIMASGIARGRVHTTTTAILKLVYKGFDIACSSNFPFQFFSFKIFTEVPPSINP